jgi:pyrimidine operon attenuation protein/uracil phosphoribosyltransferase
MTARNRILTKERADRKLHRMAMEVAERNNEKDELILIGIKENGNFIARRIAAYLSAVFAGKVTVIGLSINKKQPGTITLSESPDFNNKTIILIDDVANSGRTMLYALKPLLEQLPEKIQTLALVERTHKQFPIAVDYIGLSVSTTLQENIVVEIADGEVTGAWMD